jgi:hypothetical protein
MSTYSHHTLIMLDQNLMHHLHHGLHLFHNIISVVLQDLYTCLQLIELCTGPASSHAVMGGFNEASSIQHL